MTKNLLYKYRCKELLCNRLIRSDKWNEHWKKNHTVKYRLGTELKREIIVSREDFNSPWIPWKKAESSEPTPTDVQNTPSTSTIDE